jgi:photosystem II stability/assembly factor-like uncharacterized protein
MTDISEHITASDPVSYPELLKLSSDTVFDELFQAVVTGDDVLQSLPAGRDERPELAAVSPVRRTRPRRLVIALASSAAAAAVLMAAAAVPALQTAGGNHRAGAAHGRQPGLQGAAPAWHLAGYLSPSWRTQPGAGLRFGFSLTCPDAATCYAVDFPAYPQATGPEVEVTDDGGGTWRQLALPRALSVISPVACPDAGTCALLGDDSAGNAVFLETTDGGQKWAATAGPADLTSQEQLAEFSCTSEASCVAIGYRRPEHAGGQTAAIAYSTNDSGSIWTTANLPHNFVPFALKCVGSSMCVAVGSLDSPDGSPGMALYSADGGSTWNTASLPPAVGRLTRLSCASASDCLASFFAPASSNKTTITSSLLATADGGQSWTPAPSSPRQFITGLSCPSASRCWASGIDISHGPGQPARTEGATSFTSNAGSTWQQSPLPAGTRAVVGISCPTASNCYAIAFENARSEPIRPVLLAYGG